MVGNSTRFMGKAALEIGMRVNNNRGLTSSDNLVTEGKWHHVTATYDGVQQCLYVDEMIHV